MTTTFKFWLAGGLAAVLVLSAGCSSSSGTDIGNNSGNNSGGNPGTAGPASVPDGAGTTVASFLAFLLALDPNDETSEPLLIKDSFAVPVDEDSESKTLS